MQRKKYPLEPLVRVKKDRVETEARALGRAIATRDSLEKARHEKEAARAAARAGANLVRSREQSRLEEGASTVLDLSRGGAWEARIRAEDRATARAIDEALAAEERARAVEATTRAKVGEAKREHESVRRHEERWNAEETKRQEAREEEASAEAVRSKRGS